jgi:hypothetical protein
MSNQVSRFPKGVSGNPAGRPSITTAAAAILADLLTEYPDATPSATVLLKTAARLFALSHRAPSPWKSMKCAAEARALIKQAKVSRAARPRPPAPPVDEMLARMAVR